MSSSNNDKLTSLKLSFNGEIRRLSVTTEGDLTYPELMAKTLSVFPNLTSIQFSWVDDENDKVVISSNEELSEALRVMASENKGYLRFEVLASAATPSRAPAQTQPQVNPNAREEFPRDSAKKAGAASFGTITHVGVECDACGCSPLSGSRFKCAVRDDYDLCESCEAKDPQQPYPMVKIYRPELVPAGVMVVVEEGRGTKHGAGRCARPGAAGAACHRGIVCDGCGTRNFHGPRFKCSVRNDFDLCGACEAKDDHRHVMVKICPQHARMRIQVIPSISDKEALPYAAAQFRESLGRRGGPPHHRPTHASIFDALFGAATPGPQAPPRHGPPGRRCCAPGPCHREPNRSSHHGGPHRGRGAPPAAPAGHCFPRGKRGHCWDRASVAQAAADRARHHTAAMEEQKRAHKAKEDSRLEEEFIDMCIQESLAEGERLATAAAAASTAENEEFVKERERLRTLAFRKYALSDVAENDVDACTSNEEKGEPVLSQTPVEEASVQPIVPRDEPPVPPAAPAKLMARFVRDVTMPDGSEIAPHSTFFKTWRVRNDGQGDWPVGCHLVSAGGDQLFDSKLGDDFVIRQPVPATAAGEEVELTLELCAPSSTGRHVGYFRLEKPDGGMFGQRLWSDIRVNDSDMSVSMTLSPWEVVDSASDDAKQEGDSSEQLKVVVASISTEEVSGGEDREVETAALTTEAERDLQLEETPVLESEPVESETEQKPCQLEQEFDAAVKLWSKELRVLSAMGFNDLPQLLPLLQEHIEVPVSQQEENGATAPSSEAGLQAVVLTLLSRQQ